MKTKHFIILLCFYAPLLKSPVVAIDPPEDVKQTSETKESTTDIGVDFYAYLLGNGATWKDSEGENNGWSKNGKGYGDAYGREWWKGGKGGVGGGKGGGSGGKGGSVGGRGNYVTPIPIPNGGKKGSGGIIKKTIGGRIIINSFDSEKGGDN